MLSYFLSRITRNAQARPHIVLFGLLALGVVVWPTRAIASASCTTQLDSPLNSEDRAHNAYDAHDYGTAYAEYQQAIEYRANCVDETSGLAYLWNEYFDADDYAWFAETAADSDLWNDEAAGDWQKAQDLLHDVRSHTIRGELLQMTDSLHELLSTDPPTHSTPDDTPPSGTTT